MVIFEKKTDTSPTVMMKTMIRHLSVLNEDVMKFVKKVVIGIKQLYIELLITIY